MVAIAVGALFYIPGPGGEPLMNLERLKRSLRGEWSSLSRQAEQMRQKVQVKAEDTVEKVVQQVTSKNTESFDPSFEAPAETLFKWRDKDGNWHFSNQLPPDSVIFEIVDPKNQ